MRVCIYGASSPRIDPEYIRQTEEMAELLGKNGYDLVYGGGGTGLMGAAARGMYRAGAHIIGVVPEFLNVDGRLFDHCDETIYTENMRQRKQIMDDKAEAFVVTPGSVGTYEEFFEIFTSKQLGQHNKHIVVFNIKGYYDPLIEMMRHAVTEDFMHERSLSLMRIVDTPAAVLEALQQDRDPMRSIVETKYIEK